MQKEIKYNFNDSEFWLQSTLVNQELEPKKKPSPVQSPAEPGSHELTKL